jgi:hypothetical protein
VQRHVADETHSFATIRPVISIAFSSGAVRNGTPSENLPSLVPPAASSRVQAVLRPSRARKRPFSFVALDEFFARVAH